MEKTAGIFSCSPRGGGNSDTAALAFAAGASAGIGVGASIGSMVSYLRDYQILPCSGCYGCRDFSRGCVLSGSDQALDLFAYLVGAPYVFFSVPIFFYHMPAHFKSWVDRSHAYWLQRESGDEFLLSLPRRRAYVCLLAARKQGDQLFRGTLLTLKYFLDIFNFEIYEPVLLYGIEAAGALANSPDNLEILTGLGQVAARSVSSK